MPSMMRGGRGSIASATSTSCLTSSASSTTWFSEWRIRAGSVALPTRSTRSRTPHEAARSADRQRSSSARRDVAGVETAARPNVVPLSDPRATDVTLVGAKAANLALARAAGLPTLPGVVLTTAWNGAPARRRRSRRGAPCPTTGASLSSCGRRRPGEDGDASSMAGVFESILDVSGEDGVARGRRGGPRVGRSGPPRRPRRRRDGRARAADARRRVGRRAVRRRSAHRPPRPDGRRRRRRRTRPARVRCRRRLDGRPRPPWPRRGGPLDRRRAAPAGRRAAPARPARPGRRPRVRRPAGRRVGRRRDRCPAPAAGPSDHDAAADEGHRVRTRPGRRDVPRPAGDARAGPLARPAPRRPAPGPAAHRHVTGPDGRRQRRS